MKIGCQTIIYGPALDDLDAVLDTIAEAGFQGVEFSQRPEMLRVRTPNGSKPVSYWDLCRHLQERNLVFLGLVGGTLEERMRFCEGYGSIEEGKDTLPTRPLYLYVEDCTIEDQTSAALWGFNLALHPHVHMKNQRLEASAILLQEAESRRAVLPKTPFIAGDTNYDGSQLFGNLFWMPDTAHLYIVGDNIEEALRIVPSERMVAVHLKDWDAAYGRSYHRYAKGFTALGKGDVPVERVVTLLERMAYTGWLVAEQDYTREHPDEGIRESAAWLAARGLLKPPSGDVPRGLSVLPPPSVEQRITASGHSPAVYSQFLYALAHASSESLDECYQTVAVALRDLYDASHVSLWACSGAREDMCLLVATPPNRSGEGDYVLRKSRELWGEAVDTLAAKVYTLAEFIAAQSAWAELAETDEAHSIIALPVLNRFNPHHIRFLAVLMQPNPDTPAFDYQQDAVAIGESVAHTLDTALDDACTYVAGRVSHIADTARTLKGFLREILALVQSAVQCEGATIFLVNRTGERLEEAVSTGLAWNEDLIENEHYYPNTEIDSPTVRSWVQGEPILLPDAQDPTWGGKQREPRSVEIGDNLDEDRHNIMMSPLVSVTVEQDGTERLSPLGVIRCRNKRPRSASLSAAEMDKTKYRIFTEDDAAILDTIGQAAVPHIVLLRAEVERREAVGRLTHELAMPVNALRGAVDSLRRDLSKVDPEYTRLFRFDYIGDILSWTDLMVRVIGSAEAYGFKEGRLRLEPKPTYLMSEVIAPAVRQVRFLLEDKGFDPAGISYSNFEEIPRLYIDRSQFQQVIFNLLSNAIKYAYNDPRQFRVEIVPTVEGEYYRIACRDWGPGIAEGYDRAIFEEGVRGPSGVNRMVSGIGLGLWVVRRLIAAHGGHVAVTNLYRPTEISLYLPMGLRSAPPRQKKTT
jgi:signal transduction histidine kinase